MGAAQNDDLPASPSITRQEERMNCSECKDLYRTFERTRARFEEARSAAFFQVSTKIAARNHVNLERAQSDLREHQEACPWAMVAQHFGHHGIVHASKGQEREWQS